MMRVRPVVHVLTDGSGSAGESRIGSTTALLERVGASSGCIYGRMSDREIYRAMLARDHGRFIALAEELADGLVRDGATLIAGDAVEGFNPSHDVCRYVINAAVRIASASGCRIASYAFALDGAPDRPPAELADTPLRIDLDDAALDRKLQAAQGYAELKSEVEGALRRFGTAPFRSEYLWPVDPADRYGLNPDRIPYYERHGADRVAAGAYEHIVTFREHVKLLADALWCHRAVSA
jgi:hypothetical protein